MISNYLRVSRYSSTCPSNQPLFDSRILHYASEEYVSNVLYHTYSNSICIDPTSFGYSHSNSTKRDSENRKFRKTMSLRLQINYIEMLIIITIYTSPLRFVGCSPLLESIFLSSYDSASFATAHPSSS